MPNRLILLLVVALFTSCRRPSERQKSSHAKRDSINFHRRVIDSGSVTSTVKQVDISHTNQENREVVELDDKLEALSATEYHKLDSSNKVRCNLDSSGFIKDLGLALKSKCDDVCKTYLVENKSGKEMSLYADFDNGLLGLRVSPACTHFATYSSYDMPDYDKYYNHRALTMLYEVDKAVGLKAIRLKITFGLKQWSIMEVKWIDENSIALKLYKEAYSTKVKFAYFKVKVG